MPEIEALLRDGVATDETTSPVQRMLTERRLLTDAASRFDGNPADLIASAHEVVKGWDGTHAAYLRVQRVLDIAAALDLPASSTILVAVLSPPGHRAHDMRATVRAAQLLGLHAARHGGSVAEVLRSDRVGNDEKLEILRGLVEGAAHPDDRETLWTMTGSESLPIASHAQVCLLRQLGADERASQITSRSLELVRRACEAGREETDEQKLGEHAAAALIIVDALVGSQVRVDPSELNSGGDPRAAELLRIVEDARREREEPGTSSLRTTAESHEDPWVRMAAIHAIGRVGSADDRSLLERIARSDAYTMVALEGLEFFPVRSVAMKASRRLAARAE